MPTPAIELMVLNLSWLDIVLRLLLVTAAGALIGINRERGGHAAGFRTTILVGLAACLMMIQANLLLPTLGKSSQSFAVMDTLRFPLGVLTGVGFIGGGAILRRGDLVTGVTTAATLWIMTAIGLCIGGGQLVVGCAGAIITFVVLSPFKGFDRRIARRCKARVVIEVPHDSGIVAPAIEVPRDWVGCFFVFVGKAAGSAPAVDHISYDVRWRHAGHDSGGARLLAFLQERYTVVSFEVEMNGA
ncbi:MgtC/SapB family protein [Rhizobium lusitanum]|uniref:Protein MgtC n=1 Tax=Rhizobium lusitanum TaxID=293958 RepID=A0A7X0IXE2_9HYPH|nr:putative Mg2+ transporter-C (MgtC) family protein [Rhizobium lusitanum]